MIPTPIKVLCVLDYYLPGFKGGGPVRTVSNMRGVLAGKVDLAIFTRDRDLGSASPYDSIQANTWNQQEQGPVYYASPKMYGANGLQRAIAESQFDLLYLNSFFGFRSSIQMYLLSRRAKEHLPILIAPRGEFSPGALAIKRKKKHTYLTLIRMLGLYRDIEWHASTVAEKMDILRQFPGAADAIHLAEDPVIVDFVKPDGDKTAPSAAGYLRLAFISRISPMKNLDGLLRILATVSCQTDLDIFGQIEDPVHWAVCKSLIAALPKNVTVTYKGPLDPEIVSAVFADYDLFAFPTHGENFGHVIFEALRAGTPVLVSETTPWQTDPSGAIRVVPLGDTEAWQRELQAAADRNAQQKIRLRAVTQDYARNYVLTSDMAAANLAMFRQVTGLPL